MILYNLSLNKNSVLSLIFHFLDAVDEKYLPKDDPLKNTIGDFGLWQLKISVLMSLLKLPIAWFTLSIVFIAPPTQFWCKPPPSVNLTDEQWLRLSTPKDDYSRKQVGLKTQILYGICFKFCTEICRRLLVIYINNIGQVGENSSN